MALLFGLAAAICIGLSDLGGRRVSAASSAATTATSMNLIGCGAALLVALAIGSVVEGADVARGLISGLGLGAGLILYYAALPRVGAPVAAPILGTLTSVLPYAYAVLTGVVPSPLALIGAGLALAGIAIVTATGTDRRARFDGAGVALAIGSGLSYAAGIIAVIGVSQDAGAWPAVFQKVTGVAMAVAYCLYRSSPVTPPRGVRRDAINAGIASGLASSFYVLGLTVDPTPAIVTASMFPAFSIAVGRTFFGDAMTPLQIAGIACSLAGVAAVAMS